MTSKQQQKESSATAVLKTKDAIDLIVSDAKDAFSFRGGRTPAMTLEEGSCVFYPIDGREVSVWLTEAIYELGILPRSDVKEAIIELLTAYAMRQPGQEPCHRICQHDDHIWYKLNDQKILWVTTGNVKIGPTFKDVAFWHSAIEESQVNPDLSVLPSELYGLVKKAFRVKKNYRLVFIASLLTFFVPNLVSPVLVLSGEKGTAKTTTSKHIVELVSPLVVEPVVSLPSRVDGFISQLTNNYVCAFDNVVFPLKPNISDLLCQVVTHASFPKRELYTTNRLTVLCLRSKLIMNGIDEIAARPDFAERTCVVYLNRISEKNRRLDSEVEKDFQALKPKILGAIFNTLSAVLADRTDFSNIPKPRMAEFATFGMKVMQVLGKDPQAFLQQYTTGIADQLADAEARSPIVVVVDKLLFGHEGAAVRDTPKGMAKRINGVAERYKIPLVEQTANSVTKTLKKNSHALEASGLRLTLPKGRTNKRWIELSYEKTALKGSSDDV